MVLCITMKAFSLVSRSSDVRRLDISERVSFLPSHSNWKEEFNFPYSIVTRFSSVERGIFSCLKISMEILMLLCMGWGRRCMNPDS